VRTDWCLQLQGASFFKLVVAVSQQI